MTSRTSVKVVTFKKAIVIYGEQLPPGNYEIETEETSIDSMHLLAWRRIAVRLLSRTRGRTEVYQMTPAEFDALMAQDAGPG